MVIINVEHRTSYMLVTVTNRPWGNYCIQIKLNPTWASRKRQGRPRHRWTRMFWPCLFVKCRLANRLQRPDCSNTPFLYISRWIDLQLARHLLLIPQPPFWWKHHTLPHQPLRLIRHLSPYQTLDPYFPLHSISHFWRESLQNGHGQHAWGRRSWRSRWAANGPIPARTMVLRDAGVHSVVDNSCDSDIDIGAMPGYYTVSTFL